MCHIMRNARRHGVQRAPSWAQERLQKEYEALQVELTSLSTEPPPSEEEAVVEPGRVGATRDTLSLDIQLGFNPRSHPSE